MPNRRINEIIMDLPFAKKLLGAGLVLMLISLFLPWYQDTDSFKTGEMFLGITGPLYLIGITMFLLIGGNIALMIMEIYDQKPAFLKIKAVNIYLSTGIISFYMLMLVNSVYFHNKFGINISIKQSDFGMFFAFIGASLITIGGYLAGREKGAAVKEFEKEINADTVKMTVPMKLHEQRKPAGNLRTLNDSESEQPVVKNPAPVLSQNSAFSNLQKQLKKNLEIKPNLQQHLSEQKATVSDFIKAENPVEKAPQTYRMDL